MNLDICEELDPVFETMGLLFVSCHAERQKQETISELDKFGLDGEAFYNKHLKMIDRYVRTFSKHRVMDEQNPLPLLREDGTLFLLLQGLLVENNHWLSGFSAVSDDDIRGQLLIALGEHWGDLDAPLPPPSPDELTTLDQIVAFLNQCPFDEAVKWDLMRILRQPRAQLGPLVNLVNANLPAYEKARREVDKPLGKLIPAYVQSVRKRKDEQFIKLVEMFTQSPSIHPALIMPLGQHMFRTHCYYGLYVDSLPILDKTSADGLDFLLMRLKALADKSKLQILASLKLSPKYNLELAEQLGLTAATTSHHMNVLLACGLVGIEKKNGKVYYHPDESNIKRFLNDVEQFLI